MTIEEKIDKLERVINTMIVNQMTLVDRVDNIARIQLDKLGGIDEKLDYMMAIEDRLLKIESNAQLRDNALRDSLGTSFEKIWNYLADIKMKHMEIISYVKSKGS